MTNVHVCRDGGTKKYAYKGSRDNIRQGASIPTYYFKGTQCIENNVNTCNIHTVPTTFHVVYCSTELYHCVQWPVLIVHSVTDL